MSGLTRVLDYAITNEPTKEMCACVFTCKHTHTHTNTHTHTLTHCSRASKESGRTSFLSTCSLHTHNTQT